MNRYALMARSVARIHWALAIALIAGFVAQFFFPSFAPVEITAIVLTLVSWRVFGSCPLTLLENVLWEKFEPGRGVQGAFLAHNIEARFGIRLPSGFITKAMKMMLFVSICVWISSHIP